MYRNDIGTGEHLKRRAAGVRAGVAFCALWAVAGPWAPAAWASPALAAQKGCLGCHAVDRARVGPSFQQVAGRYVGQAGAAQRLVEKVRQGGQGQWGVAVMPAHPRLAPEEARTLVEWVLAQRPTAR